MTLTHRIQLDPTVKQRQYFAQAAGTARFVWNHALAAWNAQYEAGGKPKASVLKVQFNASKYERYPWMTGIHRDAHSQPFAALSNAFRNFFEGRSAHPKFKKKGKCRDVFYVANDKLRIDGRRVRLPIIGWVRVTEALRFAGKIQRATVSREADRWFIAITVHMPDAWTTVAPTGEPIGIDLGLTTFATLSTGEKIEAPKPLAQYLRKLKRLGRWHSRKQLKSRNRSKASMRLAKCHRRIRNIRQDLLHKLSTDLAKNHSEIGIEDLNVRGMLANHKLARRISDASWSEFVRQLTYKADLYGSKIVTAGRFFASSKTCSVCGTKADKMPLSVRTWTCTECGSVHDRDINAAINLKPNTAGSCGNQRLWRGGAVMPLAEAGTLPCAHLCAQER